MLRKQEQSGHKNHLMIYDFFPKVRRKLRNFRGFFLCHTTYPARVHNLFIYHSKIFHFLLILSSFLLHILNISNEEQTTSLDYYIRQQVQYYLNKLFHNTCREPQKRLPGILPLYESFLTFFRFSRFSSTSFPTVFCFFIYQVSFSSAVYSSVYV